jgi:phosphoribosylglycinamide formyltransferase-1
MLNVAVLASGSGSNLQALLDAEERGDLGAHIDLVVANRRRAGALERARTAGREALHLSPRGFASDTEYCERLLDILAAHHIAIVCLAGYLKKLPAAVVASYPGRVLNIHPGPLPEFGGPGMYGREVHAAVLESGASYSGPTVHFVDEEYDRGPVAAHARVDVHLDDTPETLAARVLVEEHRLYPRVVAALAAGRLRLEDGQVVGSLDA